MFVISFFYQLLSVCGYARSLFIKFGYVDLDTFIQNFIQKFNLSIVDLSKSFKIEHTRDDYTLESNNDYDMWLHNTDRKLLL